VLPLSRIRHHSSDRHFHHPTRVVIDPSREPAHFECREKTDKNFFFFPPSSLTISGTWTAYQSFDSRLKKRKQSYRSIETLMEAEDNEMVQKDVVVANGHSVVVAEGFDEKATTAHRKAAVKDVESSSRVVVTALGKLGLIMAYFYLCDR
jgi:hypothetical protein